MKVLAKDICWIYILEGKLFPHKRRIVYCGDENCELSVANHLSKYEQLVYCRQFDNVLDALAHKLMLETLSKETITHIISKQKK